MARAAPTLPSKCSIISRFAPRCRFSLVNNLSQQAALQENIARDAVCVLIEEVGKVPRILTSHHIQSVGNRSEIQSQDLRLGLSAQPQPTTFVERTVQLTQDQAAVRTNLEGGRLGYGYNLPPGFGSAFEAAKQ